MVDSSSPSTIQDTWVVMDICESAPWPMLLLVVVFLAEATMGISPALMSMLWCSPFVKLDDIPRRDELRGVADGEVVRLEVVH